MQRCSYLMARVRFGMDKELAKVASVSLTPEEVERTKKGGEVCAAVARFVRGKELIYELEVTDYRASFSSSSSPPSLSLSLSSSSS
jgi:hypothetical protein